MAPCLLLEGEFGVWVFSEAKHINILHLHENIRFE